MNTSTKWGRWMIPMNLQLFADHAPGSGAEGGTDGGAEGGAEGGRNDARQTLAFTPEELAAMIQSETDKRVTQALKKQERQFEKKMSLSGLDEQQRALAERDQRIEQLQEDLRARNAQVNRLELVRTLAGRDLPAVFADLIEVGDDPDAAQQKIDALDKAFKAAVEEAVNKRIAGRRAPGKGGTAAATMTVADIMKIADHTERQKAIEDNMELFAKKG